MSSESEYEYDSTYETSSEESSEYERDDRTGLKNMLGERKLFRATFSRYGKRVSGKRTFCVVDIFEYSNQTKQVKVANHLWFNVGKRISRLNRKLKEGDILEFKARSKVYKKGKKRRTEDVKLKFPSDWKLIQGKKVIKAKNNVKRRKKAKTNTKRRGRRVARKKRKRSETDQLSTQNSGYTKKRKIER